MPNNKWENKPTGRGYEIIFRKGDRVIYDPPQGITQYGVVVDIIQHLVMIQTDTGRLLTLMSNNAVLRKE